MYELFYGQGGHVGPYVCLLNAVHAAASLLRGSKTERIIYVVPRSRMTSDKPHMLAQACVAHEDKACPNDVYLMIPGVPPGKFVETCNLKGKVAMHSINIEQLKAAATTIFECGIAEMREEWFLKLPPQRQQSLIEDAHRRCRQSAEQLLLAIETKDIQRLLASLHTGNSGSRRIFTTLTGAQLGNTEAATRESIRQWVGAALYDAFIANREAERLADIKARAEKRAVDAREHALSTAVRFAKGGSGLVQTGTVREWIDDLLSRGFVPTEFKRGFAQGTRLVNGSRYQSLRNKHEGDYAREKYVALESSAQRS